ncbi:MAG: glutaredoxin 3 [Betaproteobacteria bacterium]|nr:glutaredoxin 3 [Betaproteobacteria bacterium]
MMQSPVQPGLEVEIFTGPNCGYCRRAKAVLDRRNLQYREVDVSIAQGRDELQRRLPRARSIPQIFIGADHIGGCEDLERLDANGTLNAMTTGGHR